MRNRSVPAVGLTVFLAIGGCIGLFCSACSRHAAAPSQSPTPPPPPPSGSSAGGVDPFTGPMCTPGVNCVPTTCGNGICESSESCATCAQDCNDTAKQPCRRIGIFYNIWQQPAAHAAALAVQQNKTFLTVEDVLRSRQEQGATSRGNTFDDIMINPNLAGISSNFYYQHHPQDGFYCIYHRRLSTDINYHAEADAAGLYDCPNYDATLLKHAQMLVAAGVDFVVTDQTNMPTYSATADVIQLRPFEVLVQQWAALRAHGQPTPDIAAWQVLPTAGASGESMANLVPNIYNVSAYDRMFMRDRASQKKVFFYPTGSPADAEAIAAVASNGNANDILPVPMWVNQQSSGAWSFMTSCQQGATINDSPCAQDVTTHSVLGSEVSVSPSYQLGYASLPFGAVGVYGGQTFRKQFAQALAVQPNFLFLSSWNEQLAQPQPNSGGASMGFENDATIDQQAFVDTYGIEFSRDIEPTVEYGTLLYDIMKACNALYRTGATTCNNANSLCCQGGAFSDTYTYYNGANGAFGLYVSNPNMQRVLLNLCVAGGSDYFLSSSNNCESHTLVQMLGYASPTKGGETLRALRRCLLNGSHTYSLSGACPANATQEALFGYVR